MSQVIYLCAVTGPCRISPKADIADVPLEEGMVLSDGKTVIHISDLIRYCLHVVGPCGIMPKVSLSDVPLQEGMILSDGNYASCMRAISRF